MVRISEVARITLEGMDSKIDHDSPLVDQARLVYEAARRFAQTQGFRRVNYLNQHPGYEGPMVMRHLVGDLFPRTSRDRQDVINGQVNQVLRKTVAAVCTKRPGPSDRGVTPEWFIADSMPDHLTVVALGIQNKDRNTDRYITNSEKLAATERKLTPQEAGEDREPAPVEVRHVDQDTPEPSKAERDLIVDERFIEEIYEQVATSAVPLTIPELSRLTDKPQWAVRHTTERLLVGKRLVYRTETKAEKLVRGGGSLPPARPSKLWWPAPGPVPERAVLPAGIEPSKSSRDHAQERANQRLADETAIIKYLEGAGRGSRTSGKVADAVRLPPSRVKDSLHRMVSQGRLRVDAGYCYYNVDTTARRPTVPVPVPPVVPVAPPAPETLIEQVHRLVDQLAQGDAVTENRVLRAKVSTLEQRVAQLETENTEMSRKLESFRQMLG